MMRGGRTAGQVINGRYRLEHEVGSGGHGAVWCATQLGVERPIALKFLHPSMNDQVRARFSREAQALAQLDHPNCLQLLDYGHLPDGSPYLAAQFLAGDTLDEWLRSDPPTQVKLDVARQICSAVAAAHAQQIVHRDLKPDNVMILPTPDGPRAIVLDFGIAKLSGRELVDITKTGEVFGTPGYMSPEQLRAEVVGPAADVYALGVMFWEMFEGRPLFEASSWLEIASLHLKEPAPPMTCADVPSGVRSLVVRMVAKSAPDRPANAREVLDGLRAETARQDSRPAGGSDKGRAIWAIALIAVVALIALVWGIWPVEPAKVPIPPREERLQETKPAAPHDAGTHPADLVVAAPKDIGAGVDPSTGCRRPHPGTGVLDDMAGAGVYVPASYDPRRPSPALIVFHDGFAEARSIVMSPLLLNEADERGFVIIAPQSNLPRSAWHRLTDRVHAKEQIDFVRGELCIDDTRIFVLGLGLGGIAASRMGSEVPGIRGVITSGHRFNDSDPPRSGQRPPRLVISAKADPHAPARGGDTCVPMRTVWSLERHENALLEQHGCAKKAVSIEKLSDSSCSTYRCKAPLTLCRAAGGRFWPGLESAIPGMSCGSSMSSFPSSKRMWAFVDEHDD